MSPLWLLVLALLPVPVLVTVLLIGFRFAEVLSQDERQERSKAGLSGERTSRAWSRAIIPARLPVGLGPLGQFASFRGHGCTGSLSVTGGRVMSFAAASLSRKVAFRKFWG
jgi:hypothetical protein